MQRITAGEVEGRSMQRITAGEVEERTVVCVPSLDQGSGPLYFKRRKIIYT